MAVRFLAKSLEERHKKKKQLQMLGKNHKNLTGNNMA
jgi:hypothetical protein